MEFKTLQISELKADKTAKKLKGHCSVKGNIDSYGDVIVAGAYTKLNDLLFKGFICPNHEHKNPIGWFTEVYEDEIGLAFEAEFHSTEEAEKWMTIIEERMAAGKFVGLSIGYMVLDSSYGEYENETVRFLKSIEIFEATITLLPANDLAHVTSFKTRNDHYNFLVTELKNYGDRLKSIQALGRKDAWIEKTQNDIEQLQIELDNIKSLFTEEKNTEDLGSKVDEQETKSWNEAYIMAMVELEIS